MGEQSCYFGGVTSCTVEYEIYFLKMIELTINFMSMYVFLHNKNRIFDAQIKGKYVPKVKTNKVWREKFKCLANIAGLKSILKLLVTCIHRKLKENNKIIKAIAKAEENTHNYKKCLNHLWP